MADRWFASDNNAAAHPRVMEALARANEGHAVGYGDDPLTAAAEAKVGSLFGPGALVRFVLNGTGANVYAIGCFAERRRDYLTVTAPSSYRWRPVTVR